MARQNNIVFDVVGTLATYDKFYEVLIEAIELFRSTNIVQAIERTIGDRLRENGIKPDIFGYLWIEVAEREYTYLSISGDYIEYPRVFEAIFNRVLWKCGVHSSDAFASSEDLAAIVKGYADMEFSTDAVVCINKLRKAGFTVWGLTMDNRERVRKYFLKAGIEMPEENLLGCDSTGIAKPDPEAYRPLFERLSEGNSKPWFAAAHQWDAAAARRTG